MLLDHFLCCYVAVIIHRRRSLTTSLAFVEARQCVFISTYFHIFRIIHHNADKFRFEYSNTPHTHTLIRIPKTITIVHTRLDDLIYFLKSILSKFFRFPIVYHSVDICKKKTGKTEREREMIRALAAHFIHGSVCAFHHFYHLIKLFFCTRNML